MGTAAGVKLPIGVVTLAGGTDEGQPFNMAAMRMAQTGNRGFLPTPVRHEVLPLFSSFTWVVSLCSCTTALRCPSLALFFFCMFMLAIVSTCLIWQVFSAGLLTCTFQARTLVLSIIYLYPT